MTAAITIFGVLASFVGIYAFYRQFVTERRKLFAFEVSRGFSVASAFNVGGDYRLSIHFTPPDGVEEEVDGAFVQFVRFANLGREAITSADIAPASPLRIEVDGARVLDISLADVSRSVCQIRLGDPELAGSTGSAVINFDFLDHHDGGLVRILTAGEAEEIEILGDVIGMPAGIVTTAQSPSSDLSFNLAFAIVLIAELSLFGLVVLIFRNAFGGWRDVWILALPACAFLLPLVGLGIVGESSTWVRRSHWLRRGYPRFKYPSDFPYRGRIFDLPVAPWELEMSSPSRSRAEKSTAEDGSASQG